MEARYVALSRPRRVLIDILQIAKEIPTVPVQRRMSLGTVAAARVAATDRPGWPSLFLKAFALVAADMPPLRRAYLSLPWAHLREYPKSVANIAIERDYGGEPCVFFGRISNPATMSLRTINEQINVFAQSTVESIPAYRKMLSFARLPGMLRRAALRLGLNMSRTRPGQFGTFGLSVYSSLGAESLHPLSPMTTTMTYGVIDADGTVTVRLIYDHRVYDGATAARALGKLEEALVGPILSELREMSAAPTAAA